MGCVEAWAQPRPGIDAGVRRDAGARRDAGTRRDASVRRDAGVDVVARPTTHGTINAQEARRVLATRNDAVRRCYETELTHTPTLHGDIMVRLRVENDGSVSETTTGGDPEMLRVARCIEEALRTLRFSHPTGGPATVAAPYSFAQGT
jgi:hypothetical protein